MIIVVRSSNIGADAHISSLSAVGLDFCHQVGGILRAGESGFLYIIGDLRDSRGSGPDERFQLCTAVGTRSAAHDLRIHGAVEHFGGPVYRVHRLFQDKLLNIGGLPACLKADHGVRRDHIPSASALDRSDVDPGCASGVLAGGVHGESCRACRKDCIFSVLRGHSGMSGDSLKFGIDLRCGEKSF